MTFGETAWIHRGKHVKKYIRVAVGVQLVTVGTKTDQ